MKALCILYHIEKDAARNVVTVRLYEANTGEYYREKEYPLTLTMAQVAAAEFKNPILRNRLACWRGLGNDTELWISQDENDLKEVQWFADGLQLLNGARITSRFSYRERYLVQQEANPRRGAIVDMH